MAFPETHVSLIRRIVATGDSASWDQFVANYWRASSRFAMRIGNLQLSDAEDVSSKVFEILYRKSLLESWLSRPDARFKTLLCTVIRNVVRNSVRSRQAESRRTIQPIQDVGDLGDPVTSDEVDLFYAIWGDELLKNAVKSLMADYHREGKGDYFRVLHGRICDALSFKDIADRLSLKPTDVENYFRHARQRLAERIELLVRKDTATYTDFSELDTEFEHEWGKIAEILKVRGGLEEAVRTALATKTS